MKSCPLTVGAGVGAVVTYQLKLCGQGSQSTEREMEQEWRGGNTHAMALGGWSQSELP